MSNFNEQKGIDGKGLALVALTLGGVGGYLWLDHKLRVEKQVTGEVISALLKLAATQSPAVVFPQLMAPSSSDDASKDGSSRQALPPGASAASSPARNASTLARLPRIELASRTYDDVFARNGRDLPVPYLRALALHESDMRARLADGPAWGLMQVIEVVREDFNRRERKTFSRSDLLNPAVSVAIAASSLALIAKSYAMNHPHTSNLQPNWRNPQFVALLTLGWNAGWSERGGVGRVVSFLEQRGVDVNINAVFDAAKAAGASPHLANPAKLAFAKQVTRQYFAELADEERVIEIEDTPAQPRSDRPAVVVEAPTAEPADAMHPMSTGESPVVVIEHSIPAYVPMSMYGVPDHAPAPMAPPSQVEHEHDMPAAPAVVSAPMGVVAGASPSMVDPSSVPRQANIVLAMQPSGGEGPIDPYDDPAAAFGEPDDPYAYPDAHEEVAHA